MLTLELETKEVVTDMINGTFFNKKILPDIDLVEFGVMAKMAAEQHMQAALGEEKAKHFKLTLAGTNQFGINISVQADEVGRMLITGAKDHDIHAKGNALSFEGTNDYEGEMVIVEVVHHPGFEGLKEQIQAIIRQAVMIASIYMKGR
jgi:hypothetical protein